MIASTIDVILSDRFDRRTSSIYSSFKILDIDESYSRSRAFFFSALIDLIDTSMIVCTILIAILFSAKVNACKR
jgi:hypothetical protein